MATSAPWWWNERDSPCPGCGHLLGEHVHEIGCTNGWDYDKNGISQSNGCECGLTLAGQHNPPSEKDPKQVRS